MRKLESDNSIKSGVASSWDILYRRMRIFGRPVQKANWSFDKSQIIKNQVRFIPAVVAA